MATTQTDSQNDQPAPSEIVEEKPQNKEPPQKEVPDAQKKKKPGKDLYTFQQSYKKANWLQKFFYTYGNPVVNSINDNRGELKYENIEDIKTNDDETVEMAKLFKSHIHAKIMARNKL